VIEGTGLAISQQPSFLELVLLPAECFHSER